MAKNIALTLTIGGVKQNITNIKELETAIKGAEEQLKGLTIGSEGFKKLSSDVKNAKGVLEDFNESVKGQELEKRVGAFAKVGEGITASFAGAQAAISLFGTESEAVAEAAAKAQSLLTIALAARSAAEGVVAVRTVAANIATYASAAAANAATTATRVLWATLAANPLGAILAVVGLLVAAYVTLTGSTKEQVNVQNELNKATSDEARGLQNSLVILTEFNGQRDLQNKEIQKLVKQYPGFNAFIDKENKLNQQGVKFIQLKIKQYELEAQAKLITQKIAENSIKILEIESQSIFDNVSFWESAWNTIKSGGQITSSVLADAQTGLANQRKKIQEVTAENERWRKSLSDVYVQTDDVLKQLKPFEEQLNTQVKLEKDLNTQKENSKKNQEELAAAYKKGLTSTIDLAGAVKELDDSLKKYNQTIERVSKIEYDAPVVEQLKNIQENTKRAAEVLVDDVTKINNAFNGIGVGPNGLPKDELLKVFKDIRSELENSFIALFNNGKGLDFTGIRKKFIEGGKQLTQDQKNILSDLVSSYEDVFRFLNDNQLYGLGVQLQNISVAWNDFRGEINETESGGKALLNILGEISAANRKFVNEFTGKDLEIAPIQFDPTKVQKNATEFIKLLETNIYPTIATRLIAAQVDIERKVVATTTGTVKAEAEGRLKALADQFEAFIKTGKIVGNNTKITAEAVDANVQKIIGTFLGMADAITVAEQKIILTNIEVNKLTKNLQDNPALLSKAIGGLVTENIDALSRLILGARTEEEKLEEQFTKKYKENEQERIDFKKLLEKQGLDLSKATYDDLLKAYIAYKKKEVAADKDAEKEKQKGRQETYNNILKGIELFSQTLNQISALTQERIRTDLKSLEIAEKKTLEKVVGESESAAAKRIEIQEEYAAKRKELEKKGAVQALQFSLVQTIANGAQAFVKALAELGPVLGPIMAGVNAALTLAQVVIIQDQISNAQAMRKGGILKAQGGMILRGPSHENGGIPLAQMGVVAEGNEAIINRQSTMNFQGLLSSINQAGGGRPLVMNNFDDSRIVEALAKQQQKPIRAYVLESDITNEQLISKRLDSLSKF
jgi:hypothetical protein